MSQTMKETTNASKLRPLGNRVLVRRLEAEEKTEGGIILPDSAKKKQEQAIVVAIGTGKKDKNGKTIEISVKVGDIVLMDKYAGQEVKVDDEEFVIARADDLIAIIEK
ncbi:MAG: co-chaperone GroES [Chlamydiales bacterium]|nr:co-chaperone GroES [Chlamydiia bacterium]MCP5508182.1 co-chaperone GroES [Chlamydiales bacterium]